MNQISNEIARIAAHNPADWPPQPGLFRIRMVRGGPHVAAQITHAMGFWSASANGQDIGMRDNDPARAGGVADVWERGTRIDFAEWTELMTNRPASPNLKINVGAMAPISWEEPPAIGHNQPPASPTIDLAAALEPAALAAWIGERFTVHTARAEALLAAHKRFLLATHAGIPDTAVATKATDFVRQLKGTINETDGERVRIKAPVLAAQRAIDGAAKAITDPLLSASIECERRVTVFMVEQDRQARAAAAEEAARTAVTTALLMDEAIATGEPEAIERATAAEVEHQTAQAIVHAPTAELTRLHVPGGGGVTSLRDNWIYEIQDISKVPTHFMMINDSAVKAAIKGGNRAIPGLTIKNQPKAGIR